MTTQEVKNEGPYRYAVLQECDGETTESWLYFIRYEGNEEALKKLREDLESFEWTIYDDTSAFDIDTDHLVSEQTAKEICLLELNSESYHRKFNGKMEVINFGFKSKDNDDKKMHRVCKLLRNGGIEDYVDGEEVDPTHTESGSEESSTSEEEQEQERPKKKKISVPKFAKHKIKHRR